MHRTLSSRLIQTCCLVSCVLAIGCGKEERVYRGKTTSQWVAQLRRLEEPGTAIKSLLKIGDESAQPLGYALADRNVIVRRHAAKALQLLGRRAHGAVDALADALSDPDEVVRTRAATTLGLIGRPAEDAVSALLDALEVEQERVNSKVEYAIVRAIGRIGAKPFGTTTRLYNTLSDADPHTAKAAADSLNRLLPAENHTAGAKKRPPRHRANPLRPTQDFDDYKF